MMRSLESNIFTCPCVLNPSRFLNVASNVQWSRHNNQKCIILMRQELEIDSKANIECRRTFMRTNPFSF